MEIIEQIQKIPFHTVKWLFEVTQKLLKMIFYFIFLDPDTILRMAEYQAMVYCKSDAINSPSDLSPITNMAQKNLRVGTFTIEATGFDEKNVLFWYIAVNIAQQSIILVHRGTTKTNRVSVNE
jgi:hypothetical protein